MNQAEAAAIIDAARANDVFLMEAFTYRCHPQMQRLVGLVRDGAIGQVQVIRVVFSYNAGYDPTTRAYGNALGGAVGSSTLAATRPLWRGSSPGRPRMNPTWNRPR